MKNFLRAASPLLAVLTLALAGVRHGGEGTFASETANKPFGKYNVLMIAVDDLRPEAGCYGVPIIKTPHIDALASQGLLFNRAYCQQAVCSPSRTSLLLGRRPDTTRVYDLQTHFRKTLPDVITLPQHFKNHGYHTQGLSKIYHGGLDDPASWSVPHWSPSKPMYGKPETLADLDRRREEMRKKAGPATRVLERDPKTGIPLRLSAPQYRVYGPAWEDPDVPDDALPDGETTNRAIELLQELKDRRFFLAVGYLKPHLPFVAPKKYYDLYRKDDIPLAANTFPPKDCPPIALTNWGELRAYQGIPAVGPLPDSMARDLVHGYYAATSYVDAQIGRLLAEVDRLGLRDSTIVVLWGDHGWHLGDHGLWCKHTNFETATRSLLIFRVPGQPHPGAKTDALVEFVDIYPTLCELCGLPIPEGLEGTSLVPLFENPQRPWKKAAFSQYPRGKVMGYSMRTDRYRYTEWRPSGGGEPVAVELYDHTTDPLENVNLAGRPEYKDLVAQLHQQLEAGWKAAKPGQ
ncbi:MAG: sulfatase [Thermogutta sp.]|jgi:arylsulfatase A-like enzyme